MQDNDVQTVRQLVLRAFGELGSCSVVPLRETLLIRDGYYAGHRFEQGELRALWLADTSQVKIYDRDGLEVKTIHVPCRSGPPSSQAA
jgi:hypothetical protein